MTNFIEVLQNQDHLLETRNYKAMKFTMGQENYCQFFKIQCSGQK
jgi:hypothetical protein